MEPRGLFILFEYVELLMLLDDESLGQVMCVLMNYALNRGDPDYNMRPRERVIYGLLKEKV